MCIAVIRGVGWGVEGSVEGGICRGGGVGCKVAVDGDVENDVVWYGDLQFQI